MFCLLCGDSWPPSSSPNLLHLCPSVALIKWPNVVHSFSPLVHRGDNTGSGSVLIIVLWFIWPTMCNIYPISFLFHVAVIYHLPSSPFSIQINTCLSCCMLSCPVFPWFSGASQPLFMGVLSVLRDSRLLRQHGVVLRVHRGPRRSHSADLRSYRFSSSLTHTDVALWSHGEQRGPWDRPNKSNLILGWCVQACLRPADNGLGQQGPHLQLLCVPRNGPVCLSWGTGHVKDVMRGGAVFCDYRLIAL